MTMNYFSRLDMMVVTNPWVKRKTGIMIRDEATGDFKEEKESVESCRKELRHGSVTKRRMQFLGAVTHRKLTNFNLIVFLFLESLKCVTKQGKSFAEGTESRRNQGRGTGPEESQACSSRRRRQRRGSTNKVKTAAPFNSGASTVSYYITFLICLTHKTKNREDLLLSCSFFLSSVQWSPSRRHQQSLHVESQKQGAILLPQTLQTFSSSLQRNDSCARDCVKIELLNYFFLLSSLVSI